MSRGKGFIKLTRTVASSKGHITVTGSRTSTVKHGGSSGEFSDITPPFCIHFRRA